jgi:hypothetical protein
MLLLSESFSPSPPVHLFSSYSLVGTLLFLSHASVTQELGDKRNWLRRGFFCSCSSTSELLFRVVFGLFRIVFELLLKEYKSITYKTGCMLQRNSCLEWEMYAGCLIHQDFSSISNGYFPPLPLMLSDSFFPSPVHLFLFMVLLSYLCLQDLPPLFLLQFSSFFMFMSPLSFWWPLLLLQFSIRTLTLNSIDRVPDRRC